MEIPRRKFIKCTLDQIDHFFGHLMQRCFSQGWTFCLSKLEEGNFVCQNLLPSEMWKLVNFLQLGMKSYRESVAIGSFTFKTTFFIGSDLKISNTQEACESKKMR